LYKTKKDLNLSTDEGQKMLHYARFCWPIQKHECPSGKVTWGENFYNTYGITLAVFKSIMEQDDEI
jgi:hypothetical protein